MIDDTCDLADFIDGIVSWFENDLIHGDWQLHAGNIAKAEKAQEEN